MASLNHSDLETLWTFLGGNPRFADLAAAVAQAESSGCQYAHAGPTDDRPVKQCTYRYTTGENSYGLWQINRDAHPTYTAAELYSTDGNALAAIAISQNGTDFTPWSTFNNGAYQSFLQDQTAIPPVGTRKPETPVSSPANPESGASTDRQIVTAWNRLSRVLAWGVPDQLRTVSTSSARIRKAVR